MMRMTGCSPAGARRRPVTEGALLRAAAYALAACWWLGAAVAAFASGPERAAPPEVRLAEALLATVAPGTRLALRPVDGAPATGPVEGAMLVDASTGRRSDLGAFLCRRLEGALDRRMRERGRREDHEALVVTASPSPIDFTALAAAAGASLSGTMESSLEGSRFLAALAANEPARMAVIWLPYQVHE